MIADLTTDAPPPAGCSKDNDCPDHSACENRSCINPCVIRDPCAATATCRVANHNPICTCPDGYIGSPTTDCRLREFYLKITLYIEYFIPSTFENTIIEVLY